MQYVTIPLGPTHVPANLDIKEMDEPVVLMVREINPIMSYKILDVEYELSLCLSAGWFEVGVIWGEQLNLYRPGLFSLLATRGGFEGPLFKTSKPLMKQPQKLHTIIISKIEFFFQKLT